jgi:uncharacterized protein (TIGR02996 family)
MRFTDEQPFLDAIFQRYHDDTPRWVYADYLDQCGDPERAELIRLQLTLARLPDDHSARPELTDRIAGLLAEHSREWTAELGDLVAGVEFRRGIADSFAVEAEQFLCRGAELLKRVRLHRLRLLDASDHLAELANCPLLAQVSELDLCSNDLTRGGLKLLLRSPYLKRLTALDLAFTGLDDAGVAALAASTALPRLTTLSLGDNEGVSSEGIGSLADSPFLSGLRSLDLSGNDIDERGIRALVASRTLSRLDTLRLNGNPVGDGGVRELARSSLLNRLLARSGRLELREVATGANGAEALAECPALTGCNSLDLSDNHLGDRGFSALLRSRHTSRLRYLRVARNQITDAGILTARDVLSRTLPRLHTLDLSGNRLTRYGVGLLLGWKGDSAVVVDTTGNVQTLTDAEAPVTVGQVLNNVLQEVAVTAALRHRITHPACPRRPCPPNANG